MGEQGEKVLEGKSDKKSVSEMKNENKTKKQLTDELIELHKEIEKLQPHISRFEGGEKTLSNINDLKETTEALFESQEQYRTLVENIDLGITLIDSNYKIIMTNAAQGKLFHKPVSEFVGKECFREFEKRNAVCPHCPGTKAMALRCRTEVETEGILDNDIRFSVKIYAFPVFSSDGAVTGFIELVEDVTERKRTEQEIGYFRRQYELILQSAGEGVLGLDLEGRHTFVNPSAASILGYEVKELIGQHSHAIWHHSKTDGSPYPEEECPICSAYQNGSVHHVKNEVFWKKDGTNFPVEYTSTPIWEEEKIAGAVVTFRDITERKRAEEALKESEEKFRKLASSAQDAMIMLDSEGKAFYCNKAFERIFGYPDREILGKDVHALIAPERYHENFEKGFARFRNTGEGPVIGKTLELDAVRKDESEFPIELSISPLQFKGKWTAIGVVRDISERKKAELLRLKSLDRQERMNQLQQVLLAPGEIGKKLKMITDSVVDTFGADFCRVWVIGDGDLCELGCMHAAVKEGPHICLHRDKCLRLMASSGRYTHTDGAHRRVPFGAYKIGRVASGQEHKFLTNDVTHDPRVHNHDWARELGLVSFAGYQLRPSAGETLGVIALFSTNAITAEEDIQLDALSSTTAQVICAGQIEEEVRKLNEELEQRVIQRTAQLEDSIRELEGFTYSVAHDL